MPEPEPVFECPCGYEMPSREAVEACDRECADLP